VCCFRIFWNVWTVPSWRLLNTLLSQNIYFRPKHLLLNVSRNKSKCDAIILTRTLPNADQFSASFTNRLSNKSKMKYSWKIPPHPKHVATLSSKVSGKFWSKSGQRLSFYSTTRTCSVLRGHYLKIPPNTILWFLLIINNHNSEQFLVGYYYALRRSHCH